MALPTRSGVGAWDSLSNVDRSIGLGSAVVFVAGFLPWWCYTGPLHLYGASVSGWSSGFTAWAGILLLTAAGALHLAALRASDEPLPWKQPAQPNQP